MKRIYIQPSTVTVQVRLIGSVMDGIDIGQGSPETNIGVAKENDFDFDDDGNGFTPDLWGDDEDEEY